MAFFFIFLANSQRFEPKVSARSDERATMASGSEQGGLKVDEREASQLQAESPWECQVKTVGYLVVDGFVNSEMGLRFNVLKRYNLKGQLISAKMHVR